MQNPGESHIGSNFCLFDFHILNLITLINMITKNIEYSSIFINFDKSDLYKYFTVLIFFSNGVFVFQILRKLGLEL